MKSVGFPAGSPVPWHRVCTQHTQLDSACSLLSFWTFFITIIILDRPKMPKIIWMQEPPGCDGGGDKAELQPTPFLDGRQLMPDARRSNDKLFLLPRRGFPSLWFLPLNYL